MALTFTSGSTDHVDHGSAAALDDLDPVTYLFWVYFSTWPAFRLLHDKDNQDTKIQALTLITDGFSFRVRRATSPDQLDTGNTGLAVNTWTCIAFTYDSTAASGSRVTYFQGTLTSAMAQQVQGGTGVGARTTDAPGAFFVGGNNNNAGWGGEIATAMVWDRVLTLGELIQAQFRPRSTSGCVFYSQYGFGGATTQPDWSGQGNTGTGSGLVVADHVPVGQIWASPEGWRGAFAAAAVDTSDPAFRRDRNMHPAQLTM